MANLELTIFDCDGVLVDSERVVNRVFSAMLNDLGLELELDDMFEHFIGRSMPQCMERITKMLGHRPPDDFLPAYYERRATALASVQPVPGVVDALDAIGVPVCVASSGDHEKMHLTLGTTGLLPRFAGQIYSVTDVANPKPAPDIYLHAARKNGVPPEACAVVEDTTTGVTAGARAGMHVFAYADHTSEDRLAAAGAHWVFDDMRELPALLGAVFPEASIGR